MDPLPAPNNVSRPDHISGKGPNPTISTQIAQEPTVTADPEPAETAATVTAPVNDKDSDNGTTVVPTVTASGLTIVRAIRVSKPTTNASGGCLPMTGYPRTRSLDGLARTIVPGRDSCKFHFNFNEPVNITHLEVSFWK